MFRKAIIAITLLTASFLCASSYAADKNDSRPNATDVRAEIVSVDIAAPAVVIKRGVPAGGYRYVTLNILPETGITKGDSVLTVADLKPGDKATFEYVTDPTGGVSAAISIYLEGDNGPGPDILIENEPGNVMTLGGDK